MIDQNHGEAFTGYDGDRARKKAISQTAGMISTETLLTIRDRLVSGEYRLGETVTVRALAAGDADVLYKDMKRQTRKNLDSENWILLKESIDANGLSVLTSWRDSGRVSIRPYLGVPRLDLLGWTILERQPGFFGSASSTQPERAGIAAARGRGGDVVRRDGQSRVVGLGLARAVGCHRQDRWRPVLRRGGLLGGAHAVAVGVSARTSPRTSSRAPASLSTISAAWRASMMKGGASRIWAPRAPSMVPPPG